MSCLMWFHVNITKLIIFICLCCAAEDSGLSGTFAQHTSQISVQNFGKTESYNFDISSNKLKSRHKRQADEEDVVNQFEIERVSPPYELSYEIPQVGNYIENFWGVKTTNSTKDEFFSFYDFEVQDREVVSSVDENTTPRTLPQKKNFSPSRLITRQQNDKEHVVTGSGKRSPDKGSLNQYEQHRSFLSSFGNYSVIEVQEDDEVHMIGKTPPAKNPRQHKSKYDDEHVINRSPGSRQSRGPPADLILVYHQGVDQRGDEDKRAFKTGTKVLLLNYQKSSLKHSSQGDADSTFKSHETGKLNLTLTGTGNITGKGLVSKKEVYIPFGKRLSTQGLKLPKPKQEEPPVPEIQSRDGKVAQKVVTLNKLPAPAKQPGLQTLPRTTKIRIPKFLMKDSILKMENGAQNVTTDAVKSTSSPLSRGPVLTVIQSNKKIRTTPLPATVYFRLGKAVKETQTPSTTSSDPPVDSTDQPKKLALTKHNARKGKLQKSYPKYSTTNVTTTTKALTETSSVLSSTPVTLPIVYRTTKRSMGQTTVKLRLPKTTLSPGSTVTEITEREKQTVTSGRELEKLLQGSHVSTRPLRISTTTLPSKTTTLSPKTTEEVTSSTLPSPTSIRDVLAPHYESMRVATGRTTTVPSTSEAPDLPEVTTQVKGKGILKFAHAQLHPPQTERTSKILGTSVPGVIDVPTTTRKFRFASLTIEEPTTKGTTVENGSVKKEERSQALFANTPTSRLNVVSQTAVTSTPAEISTPPQKKVRKIHFEPKRNKRPYHLLPTGDDFSFSIIPSTASMFSTESTVFSPNTAKTTKASAALKGIFTTTTSRPKSTGRDNLTFKPTESTITTSHSSLLERQTTNSPPKVTIPGTMRGKSRKTKQSNKSSPSTASPENSTIKAYPLSIGVVVSSDARHDKPNLPFLVVISPTKRPGRTVTTSNVEILSTLVNENLTALISAYDDDDEYDYDDDDVLGRDHRDGAVPYKGFLKLYLQPVRRRTANSGTNREIEKPVAKTTGTYGTGQHKRTKSSPTQKKRPTPNAGNDTFREELSTTTESTNYSGKSKNTKQSVKPRRKPKVLPSDRTQRKAKLNPSVEYESSVTGYNTGSPISSTANSRQVRPENVNRMKGFSYPRSRVNTSGRVSTPSTESSTSAPEVSLNVPTQKVTDKSSRLKAATTRKPNTGSPVPSDKVGSTASSPEDGAQVPETRSVNRKEEGKIRFPPRKAFEDFHFQPVRIRKIG